VSVHAGSAARQPDNKGRTPVRERILDTRGQGQDGDARNVINARRTGNTETQEVVGYHPRRGGHYDSREDHSPMPEPLGTRVFSWEIRTASFPLRSASPRRSISTHGRRTLGYGSTTTAWHASWAEPPTTSSSSATCRCTSQIGADVAQAPAGQLDPQLGRLGPHLRRELAGYVGTLGTCVRASRSPASCSGTSYGASPSAVQSSPAWPNPRSCTPSSRVQPAGTSCASSGAARRSTPTSYLTSPPALLPARRRWGAIFDGKNGKRVDDEPAEGSKSKEPQ
jgi:hypothetical protein